MKSAKNSMRRAQQRRLNMNENRVNWFSMELQRFWQMTHLITGQANTVKTLLKLFLFVWRRIWCRFKLWRRKAWHTVHKLDPIPFDFKEVFSKTSLSDKYEKCREQTANKLSSVWTRRTTEPYLSLTVHVINSEWKRCTAYLETSYFAFFWLYSFTLYAIKEYFIKIKISHDISVWTDQRVVLDLQTVQCT